MSIDPVAFNRGRQLIRELIGSQLADRLDDEKAMSALTDDLDQLSPTTGFMVLYGASLEGMTLAARILEEWAESEVRRGSEPGSPVRNDSSPQERGLVLEKAREIWGSFVEGSILAEDDLTLFIEELNREKE